ncbi:hypothetical protein Bravens_02070 [Brevibacterium ravenspurgense]|uniref:Gram-positive cocci surface proteins LPxTG domain-containing protein n=1 Tax=Brevibacterium ravenspurgense TaxID=479117 RepID=A0A150H4X7_9MICO|nr:hypothetical protein [Brevibacterium ravenspurgense]KXZ57113.1 hypothetical protein Bravens_02070 [Brevibacterium ravenspurgense]
MKKTILAPAVALSLGLTGSLGAIAAPAFADETAKNEPTAKSQQEEQPTNDGTTPSKPGEDDGNDTEDPNNPGEGGKEGPNKPSDGGNTDGTGDEDSTEEDATETNEGEEGATDIGSAEISANKITLSEFREKGVDVSYMDGEPGNTVDFWLRRSGSEAVFYSDQVEVDESGNAGATLKPKIDDEHAEHFLGEYELDVFLAFETHTVKVDTLKFSVVADEDGSDDEAPAKDAALKLSEKKVKAADFVNEEKGLNAVVSNLEPGTEVKFNVAGTSGNAKNVRPFKQTVKADKDGNAVFSIKGISEDNPSAYLGKYTVTAEFDGQKLEDSFEVVSGKGGKSDSEESGSGGGSVSGGASDNVSGSSDSGTLPRTGQGLGGLAAGAALLTVGGAAVLLTRRTRKA